MDIPCRDQLGGLSRFSADERFMYDATIYTYDAPSCLPKFTGKERDTESGLDNFGKRYHGGLAHPLGPFPTEGCPSIRAKALSRQKYPGRCVSTACFAREG